MISVKTKASCFQHAKFLAPNPDRSPLPPFPSRSLREEMELPGNLPSELGYIQLQFVNRFAGNGPAGRNRRPANAPDARVETG